MLSFRSAGPLARRSDSDELSWPKGKSIRRSISLIFSKIWRREDRPKGAEMRRFTGRIEGLVWHSLPTPAIDPPPGAPHRHGRLRFFDHFSFLVAGQRCRSFGQRLDEGRAEDVEGG